MAPGVTRYTVSGADSLLCSLGATPKSTRFADRIPRASSKPLAATKPARSPAAARPKDSQRALKDVSKEVSVFNASGAGRTTILTQTGEYGHMLSFARKSHAAVENACVAASKTATEEKDQAWDETVGSGAISSLMNAYAPKCRG